MDTGFRKNLRVISGRLAGNPSPFPDVAFFSIFLGEGDGSRLPANLSLHHPPRLPDPPSAASPSPPPHPPTAPPPSLPPPPPTPPLPPPPPPPLRPSLPTPQLTTPLPYLL